MYIISKVTKCNKYIEKYIDSKNILKQVKLAQINESLNMYTIKPKKRNRKN